MGDLEDWVNKSIKCYTFKEFFKKSVKTISSSIDGEEKLCILTDLKETHTKLPVQYHHEKGNCDLVTFYSRYFQLTYGGIHSFTK